MGLPFKGASVALSFDLDENYNTYEEDQMQCSKD